MSKQALIQAIKKRKTDCEFIKSDCKEKSEREFYRVKIETYNEVIRLIEDMPE